MDNPYQSPNAAQTLTQDKIEGKEIADRGTRLVSGLIDGLIMGSIIWILILFVFGYKFQDVAKVGIGMTLVFSLIGIISFLLVQGNTLNKYGQTIGKRIMKIKIANLDGSKPDFLPLIMKRYLAVWIVSSVPIVGGFINLINILFIFRKDRRCIHDLIAGTEVVKV